MQTNLQLEPSFGIGFGSSQNVSLSLHNPPELFSKLTWQPSTVLNFENSRGFTPITDVTQ
jgi:hypothetical protein